jgi:hypothetical protein
MGGGSWVCVGESRAIGAIRAEQDKAKGCRGARRQREVRPSKTAGMPRDDTPVH